MKTWVGRALIGGFAAFFLCHSVPAAVLYVCPNSTAPAPPYSSWSTAAQDIQSAVNAANPGDEVLVTNGVYATGGTSMSGSNRISVTRAILLQSLNGPAVTIIRGCLDPQFTNSVNSMRCVYLAGGATLSGFTLTNGSTINGTGEGGGVFCASTNSMVTNCIIAGNFCSGSGAGGYLGIYNCCQITGNQSWGYGGGVDGGDLTNSLVAANSANWGGGAYYPNAMVNCTVVNNTATAGGGGVFPAPKSGTLLANSIIYYNSASPGNGNGTNVYLGNSYPVATNCSSPDLTNAGCITNPPGLAADALDDFHLQIGSPCIDAGNNNFMPLTSDLDGNPRIFNGTVDMGAYESQFNGGVIHYVNLKNPNPASPYTNWLTAATNIQNAIDAANPGESVIVSNGVYQTGGEVVYGVVTNRIAVNKPILVASLNGPTATLISGFRLNGPNDIRCVYLTNGATLQGFTLTNGGTANAGNLATNQAGAGAWAESTNAVLEDCILTLCTANSEGGGAYSGMLSNCVVTGCNAFYGGGTISSRLINCLVSNCFATGYGGGVSGGYASGSILSTNHSGQYGGGANSNVLVNTILFQNWSVKDGGGAFFCTLTNCTLAGNVTTNGNGGGAVESILTGCLLLTNRAGNGGAGCSNTFFNCQLLGNAAANGGGAYYGNLVGCTVSNNTAGLGGGSCFGNLTNCLVTANGASLNGGGAAWGICFGCLITNCGNNGIFSNLAYNCVLGSNYLTGSSYSTLYGCRIGKNVAGGSSHDVLYNCCIFNGNNAVSFGVLNNCTVMNNFVGYALNDCIATNCIVYNNPGGNYSLGNLSYCCTTPLPPGPGNFTNAPIFSDLLHEESNSPTIGTGIILPAVGTTDIDGRPRIVNGTVDIGASEFQGTIEPFILWLDQYGLPDDGSADYTDSDGTGMNNWQKWLAGLNPTNPASVLKMSSLSNSVTGTTITWQSVTGVTYYVQSSSDLGGQPAFTSIQSNIVGQVGFTSFTDPTSNNGKLRFYRVGVQ